MKDGRLTGRLDVARCTRASWLGCSVGADLEGSFAVGRTFDVQRSFDLRRPLVLNLQRGFRVMGTRQQSENLGA